MKFIGWMMDVARDQSPRADWLEAVLARSRDVGYNAVGLYLEHRYAYPSAPWAAASGCLTPTVAGDLVRRFRSAGLRIIPFLNTLGHMEGFIRSEGGQWLAESSNVWSLQLCPSRPECADFARQLVADALPVFDDEWVHIGGDEAWELGNCPHCAARLVGEGKAGLYGRYYGDLCRWVLKQGRRPCLWGDMLLNHPEALAFLPRETLLFDWQYFTRPAASTRRFRDAGFDVVCCPSVQTYNSGWCFLPETRRNIDEHAQDAAELAALGVLVTTWEFTFFSHYAAVLPLIYAAGRRLARREDWRAALSAEAGETFAAAAEILGERVPAAAGFLRPGAWRQLRDRFVIRQNPFELWKAWRAEALGEAGDTVLRLCDEARRIIAARPSPACDALLMPIVLHETAVRWVRIVEQGYQAYARGQLGPAADALHAGVDVLDELRPELERIATAGGSRADLGRLERLKEKARSAATRIQALPVQAACRPAFQTLVHDHYISGDQAAWRTGEAFSPS